jgi:hypothetical protein
MKESRIFRRTFRRRGQSIVEFAMMAPILLILLSALFEFGFIFSSYLALIDSARNSARFSSDSQYDIPDDGKGCEEGEAGTMYFYRQTACLALMELADEQPTIKLCLPGSADIPNCDPDDPGKTDDIIISVFSVLREERMEGWYTDIVRFPDGNEQGWSFAADLSNQSQTDPRSEMHISQFTNGRFKSMLYKREDPVTHEIMDEPNSTGYLLVEVNYHYYQALALPWFTQFVPNPVLFRVYAIWPLTSAEPTSTS